MLAAILSLALVPGDPARLDAAGWRSPAVRCQAMAARLRVSPPLRPIVADMCRRSPTFRRQVARLASQHDLVVSVTEAPFPLRSSWRAHTAITRIHGRVRSADVRVQTGDSRAAVELLAHEFEHILEQLDDVDLARWIGRSGVTRIGSDRDDAPIETERARQVGHLVAGEYLAAAPQLTVRGR